ncbi:putative zinc finger protein-like [Iris pallida]|uniref:Zinc finger protein-like n=1 Tax=Iris pallida TaxID=29817 RepID=A0AAX6E6X6_IRIPA|nr:putative zinc finger protein-like [Iris pallida]
MMDYHMNHSMLARRSSAAAAKDRTTTAPAVRWVKDWVPQEIGSTGKKCLLFKWVREDTLKVLKEKCKEPEPEEAKPEPTTEILYLCSYEGCNKSFPNEASYRKHSQVHGERQYACSYPGCLKKFLDSSKLKRHQVVHTGVKNFRCPVEGCGKAFNLDFNLRAHMRTHSQEHYHVCPYSDCGKRYTQECKLKTHIKVHHEKNNGVDMAKRATGKLHATVKIPAVTYGSGSSERPFVCHYKGCGKDYIHEYKLNLHLKNVHHEFNPEDNSTRAPAVVDHAADEASDYYSYIAKGGVSKNSKRSKPSLIHEMPSAKVAKVSSYRRDSPLVPTNVNPVKKPWPVQEMYDEDSEETEEEEENVRDGRWRYHEVNGGEDDDDEETDDEQ